MTTPGRRFRIRRTAAGWLEALIDGRYAVERHETFSAIVPTLKRTPTSAWVKVADTRTLRGAHRIVARHQRAGVVWEQPGGGT